MIAADNLRIERVLFSGCPAKLSRVAYRALDVDAEVEVGILEVSLPEEAVQTLVQMPARIADVPMPEIVVFLKSCQSARQSLRVGPAYQYTVSEILEHAAEVHGVVGEVDLGGVADFDETDAVVAE